MPLTPILRRTVAIFRERPLLFTLPPFVLALAALINLRSGAAGAPIVELAGTICLFLYATIGSPIVYALLVTLTLQAEEASPISIVHAWDRVRHQAHLVGTAFVIEALFAGTIIIITIAGTIVVEVLPALNVTFPASGTIAYCFVVYPLAALILAWLARIFLPLALAIPLVLIKRPPAAVEFHALDESRRLSRGIFWPIAAIVAASMAPGWILAGIGHLIHLPSSIAGPVIWTGRIIIQIIGAAVSALLYIALTLIAIDRVAVDSLGETLPLATPEHHPASQVVIL